TLGFDGGTLGCHASGPSKCTFDTGACTMTTTCGNNNAEAGEQCDGSDKNGATCMTLGYVGGTLGCTSCHFDTSMCNDCGDGFVDSGEQCDMSNLNGKTCTTVGGGFTAGTLSCTAGCAFNTSACTTCGNNILETGETCDTTH